MATPPASRKVLSPSQPAKPAAKPKRRKFAAGDGTPRTRLIMLGAALLCVVAAFLLPRPADDDELPPPARPKPGPAAAQAPAPQTGVQAPAAVPAAAVTQNSGATAAGQPDLPPVRDALPPRVVKPEELEARLKELDPYFRYYKPEEREDAYKILLACGPALVAQLPKLIETADGPALCQFARAAGELKVADALPALIARLEAKNKPAVAQIEMLKAVASFDDPKARAYLLDALKGRSIVMPPVVWGCFGENMNAEQLKVAFAAAAGGGPNSLLAAQAIGRYGTPGDKAALMVPAIQGVLPKMKGTSKLRMVQALAGMNRERASTALALWLADDDPEVRAAALTGLAHSPGYTSTFIDALHRDTSPQVRRACAIAMAESPTEELLPELIELLDDEELRPLVHRSLVRANKGNDLGKRTFVWRDWYHARHPPQPPKPKAPPAEGAEEPEDEEAPQEE